MNDFHANCNKCPLNGMNKVLAEMPEHHNGIMLIGEAPGAEEDMEGKPFIGASGRLLNWALAEAGIKRHECWITNTIKCRPPKNSITSHEAKEALQCCRPQLDYEIRKAKEAGIKAVGLLGTTPKNAFAITEKITDVRGSVYQKYNLTCIPTIHPAFLFRGSARKKQSANDEKSEPINYIPIFVHDLKKLNTYSKIKFTPPKTKFKYHPTLTDLKNFNQSLIEFKQKTNKLPLVGFDIETDGLNGDYAEVVCISIGTSEDDIMVVPFYTKGKTPYWNSYADQCEAKKLLNEIFANSEYLIQNALFDVLFLRKQGFKISLKNVRHDLMLLHHTINAELPHNLGFITSIYGKTAYWKEPFKHREGSIYTLDNFVLWKYNGLDTSVMFQCLPEMLQELDAASLRQIYEEEVIPLLYPVGNMIEEGIDFNFNVLKKLTTQIKSDIELTERELKALGKLPDAFNISSNDDVRYFLFGEMPNKLKDIEHYFNTIENIQNPKVRANRKQTNLYKENLRLKELKEHTKPLHDLKPYKLSASKSGAKTAINRQALMSVQIKLQNKLSDLKDAKKSPNFEAIEEIETLLSWIAKYNKWSKLNKLLTTYSESRYKLGKDGRIHTMFLIHGTATGRLSSKNPNLQNLPKKDLRVRKAFIAPEGHNLLSADYSNLEVRILAYVTQEPILMEVFDKNLNAHDINTKILFAIDEQHPMWEVARSAAKIFFFGNIAYGGGDRTIYEKVILACPELNLTFKQFQEAHKRYEETCKTYKQWHDDIINFATENRFVMTPFGRRRDLFGDKYDIKKQALNTPIQGGASHVINKSMIILQEKLDELNLKSKILLQIHDQIVLKVPYAEMHQVSALMKSIMETPFTINDKQYVFPVDMSYGKNLGELAPCKPEDFAT